MPPIDGIAEPLVAANEPGSNPPEKKGNPLVPTVYLGLVALIGFAGWIASKGNTAGAIAGTLVIVAAAFPGFLWAIGKAKGFPIFPIFAAPYAINYGVHFMTNDAIVASTPQDQLMAAGAQITGFLLLATAVWLTMVTKPPRAVQVRARVIHGSRSIAVLFGFLTLFALFCVANSAGWLWGIWRYYSILRAFAGAFGALSTFALAYLLGTGELSKPLGVLFVSILGIGLLGLATGLLLFQAFGVWLLTVAGYVLGGKRVPWIMVGVSMLIFSTLHIGKYGMREKYWSGGDQTYADGIQPWEYPAYFGEWIAFGLGGSKHPAIEEEEDTPDMLERSSLLQMYLMAKSLTPLYGQLDGATYACIPSLLVPRVLVQKRISPTEVNALITLHYHMLTPEESLSTSIAWGLFNEAYANFGYAGLAGLAVVLGSVTGWATRWSMGYPIVSFRGLIAIVLMNLAAQFDQSSGTIAASLSQSTIAVLGLTATIMQTRTITLSIAERPAKDIAKLITQVRMRPRRRPLPA
jgi:hypothetical protein